MIIQLEHTGFNAMKMTKNRKLILQALAESNEYENPPYSASSVRYTLETAFEYKWQGYDMKTLPSLIQIHRTLKELWHSGLIVGMRKKADWYDKALPCWIVEYQLSSDVEKITSFQNARRFTDRLEKLSLEQRCLAVCLIWACLRIRLNLLLTRLEQ